MTKVNQSGPQSACCLVYNYQLMARVFENVNNTEKIVMHNARERTLGISLAIHLASWCIVHQP